jgi:DNA-binding SARP family transcriptional activator/tetratricopeptide (TPR) repeat protein
VGRGAGPLRVHVIGTFRVEGFAEHDLGSRKARTAMRLLAIAAGVPVSTDRVAAVLWPDAEQPRDPGAQIAVIMSRLRRVLGPARITHSDAGYVLHVDWLDLTAAAELLTEAERRLEARNPAAALAAALSARGLLAVTLLDDEIWLEHERLAVSRLAARAGHLVARAALLAGDLATGVEAAERLIDFDTYDEEALRLAMAGLSAQGRSSSALALHERIRSRLADDLGVSPSPETDAAHRAVLKGLPIPGIEVASRVQREPTPDVLHLFDRSEQLQALGHLFAAAAGGSPQVAVIEGEPGAGKTALARAWLGGLDADVRVLDTRCDQLSRMLPLQPAVLMLRSFLRQAGTDDAVALLGEDAAMLEAVLDWRVTGRPADRDTFQLLASSPAGIAMIFAALTRVVTRVCSETSVLFIDDAQRADALTSDWIDTLAQMPDVPLLILLTRRTGEGRVPQDAQTIPVSPLSLEATSLMVGPERAGALYLRTGGNPLFLSALARSDAETALPESIQTAVLERCAEAGADAAVLRDTAVLGTNVDVDLVAQVLRIDPIVLLGVLEQGLRLQLMEERDGTYAYRHEIVREALELSVGSPRRALLHREAARALTARADADPLLIAHHARLSGAANLASDALTAASGIAAARFDYETALGIADEAITAMDTTAARLRRATVLLAMARYEDARDDAEVAVARGDQLRAYEVAGAIAYYCRDFARAATLGSALLENAETHEQRVQAHVIQARAFHAEGDLRAAGRHMDGALRICRRYRVRQPTAVFAWFKVHAGDPDSAITALESSTFGTRETDSTIYTPAHAHFIYGYALATCGRAGEALRVLERASDEAHHRGLVRYGSLGTNMSSWVLRNIGESQRARECNHRASESAKVTGYSELEVYAVLDLCDDDLASGDTEAAEARLGEARSLMHEPYAYRWRHVLRVQLLEGRLALRRGALDAALTAAERVVVEAGERLAPRYGALGEALAMQARAALGEQPAPAGVVALSDALTTIAGLEAWRILGELGSQSRLAVCFELATRHRDRLAERLDPAMRGTFSKYADRELAMMRRAAVTA